VHGNRDSGVFELGWFRRSEVLNCPNTRLIIVPNIDTFPPFPTIITVAESLIRTHTFFPAIFPYYSAMQRLKHSLKSLISTAVQRAYPVSPPIPLDLPKASQNCDFVCKVPGEIYDKYQKEGVCFGLFNTRELADGVFVHIERSPMLRKVKVNGLGELEFTLDEAFLDSALGEINGKFEMESRGKGLEGVNLMVDWRNPSSSWRAFLAAESILRCFTRIGIPAETRIYGEMVPAGLLADPSAALTKTKSLLRRKQEVQSTADFVKGNLPIGKGFIHMTDVGLRPALAEFEPIHVFSPVFDCTGKQISASFSLTSSSILKMQATSSILPVQIRPSDDQISYDRLSLLFTLPAASNPSETASTRRLSVLLAQYCDIVYDSPRLGPVHLASYLDSIVQTTAQCKGDLSPRLAEATGKVAAQACSLLCLRPTDQS